MNRPKAPQMPDPFATAQAQSGVNRDTAITQQVLNMMDQSNPYGSLNFSQTGEFKNFIEPQYDDKGKLVPGTGQYQVTPRFKATSQFSPIGQKLFDQQNEFDLKTNKIAIDQTGKIGAMLGKPFGYDVGQHEQWAGGLYDKLNQESNAKAIQSMDSSLANKGLKAGSTAYGDTMGELMQGQQQARDRFMLDTYGQGFGMAQALRNQPINEITALMSGGQVQSPSFGNTPAVSVAGSDYAGGVQQQYAGQMNQYNQAMNQYNSGMGGLFQLGAAALPWLL